MTEQEKLAAELLEKVRGSAPNADGYTARNVRKWVGSHAQNRGIDRLVAGIALKNDAYVADGWRAIEAAFRHQTPEGNFGDSTQSVAIFTAWANHAILLLQAGEYEIVGKYTGEKRGDEVVFHKDKVKLRKVKP